MSTSSEAASLYLAVLPSSNGLIASLSDLNVLAQMESVDAPRSAMIDLERQCRDLPRVVRSGREGAPQGSAHDDQLRTLGAKLLDQLLPPGITSFLHAAAPGLLTIQLDPSLLWVPWELAWDGERFLGEKFRVCRRIVGASDSLVPPRRRAPQRGALRILASAGGSRDHSSASWIGAHL